MAGFFKGLLRANLGNYGDLEGPMTKLKKGKLTITIEKGKCIAWIVGADDIELNRETVKSVELISGNVKCPCASVAAHYTAPLWGVGLGPAFSVPRFQLPVFRAPR